MPRNLTNEQIAILEIMRARGAHFIASNHEQSWRNGEHAYVDTRSMGCIRGFKKLYEKANKV